MLLRGACGPPYEPQCVSKQEERGLGRKPLQEKWLEAYMDG